MSSSPQPSAHEQTTLWRRAIGISCASHIFILFLLLYVHGYPGTRHVIINMHYPADAKIIMLPLYKIAPKSTNLAIQNVHKRKHQKNARPASTTKKSPKTVVQSNKSTNRTGTIPQTKLVQTKPTTHTHAQLKAASLKQQEPDKPNPIDKKQEQQQEKQQSSDMQNVANNDCAHAPPAAEQTTPQSNDEYIVYVGREEHESIMIAQSIKEQIEPLWQPPAGLGHNLSCAIHVVVDAQGHASTVTLDKKSGAAIFDIQARNVAQKIVYPESIRGKSIVLHFT